MAHVQHRARCLPAHKKCCIEEDVISGGDADANTLTVMLKIANTMMAPGVPGGVVSTLPKPSQTSCARIGRCLGCDMVSERCIILGGA